MNTLKIAENIVQFRKKKGVTQDEMASFLGVTKASVSKWENGQSMPDIMMLPQLATYFDVTVDDLIGYEPQLAKEQIQKIYRDLCKDFAEKPFDTDLVFSASLPAAANTWLIIPLGIAAFAVFYLVFKFAITKWDLKTPGREDDQEGEMKIELANNDYTAMAQIILEGLGGKENVASIDHCITRLRLEVKDRLLVDEAKIKSSGASGVIRPGKTAVQVVIGPKVQFVFEEFKKIAE